MKTVIIPQDIREEVLFPLGYPFLEEDDFDELVAENTKGIDIIQRYVDKSIRRYNIVNPPLFKNETEVSRSFEIDYPENTYGISNARLITIKGSGTVGPGAITNVFSNLHTMSNAAMIGGGEGGRAFGTPYNFGLDGTNYLLNKARMQGYRDNTKALTLENDLAKKILKGTTNMSGRLKVTWLKTITMWEEIPDSHKEDVMSLASGFLLIWLGGLIEKGSIGDLPVDIDGQAMIDDGKDLKKEILDKWASYPQVTKV